MNRPISSTTDNKTTAHKVSLYNVMRNSKNMHPTNARCGVYKYGRFRGSLGRENLWEFYGNFHMQVFLWVWDAWVRELKSNFHGSPANLYDFSFV